jgi:hypothetical protein
LFPAAIGDHDSDGVSDLMVEFNASAAGRVLAVGEAVRITVTGILANGGIQGLRSFFSVCPGNDGDSHHLWSLVVGDCPENPVYNEEEEAVQGEISIGFSTPCPGA